MILERNRVTFLAFTSIYRFLRVSYDFRGVSVASINWSQSQVMSVISECINNSLLAPNQLRGLLLELLHTFCFLFNFTIEFGCLSLWKYVWNTLGYVKPSLTCWEVIQRYWHNYGGRPGIVNILFFFQFCVLSLPSTVFCRLYVNSLRI